MSCDIGLVGIAVMGENLVLNMESKGFKVAVFNRTTSKVDDFINGRGKGKNLVGCHSVEELAKNLKKPRKIMIMVRAGSPVDETIKHIVPTLEEGDIIIDGGNSHYPDTTRRQKELAEKKILFVGAGVSGGEEGALNGPSIMPGGSSEAWKHIKPIFQSIAAHVEDGKVPCCDWIGEEGSGHYVKMVHNGIEYGDMQLICEAYHIMKNVLKMTNQEIHDKLDEWNKGELDSYLIEITKDIVVKKDDDGKYVVDTILDVAGQKGTGKWTVNSALDLGMPLTMIAEAVFARCLSSIKDQRVEASKILPGPEQTEFKGDREAFLHSLSMAVYASKLVSYTQGYVLFRAAAKEFKWDLAYGAIALMWRGGCIIRSKFLSKIKEAFDKNKQLENLLFDDYFKDVMSRAQKGWREVASTAQTLGIAAPCITSALAYYDGLRTSNSPANLLQAQRDFFGAHTYEKVGEERGKAFHTNWTGHGGSTSSTTYTV